MQTVFYVSSGEEQLGPFSIEEIGGKLKAGALSPTDYLYLESVEDWVLLMEYKELAGFLKPKKPAKPAKPAPSAQQHDANHAAAQNEETNAANKLEEKKEEWYVLKGSDRFGPFSYRELIRMLQEKQVYEFDYVWKAPMETWARVAELECFHADEIAKLSESEDPSVQQLFFRRRHARKKHGASLIVHDNAKVWKGEAMEISEGGAGIQMHNSMLLPGQKVFVHFKPSDGLPSFNVMCEIVNKKFVTGVRNSHTPVTYGVRFLSMNGDMKDSIRNMTVRSA
jgi:hypothetical protein